MCRRLLCQDSNQGCCRNDIPCSLFYPFHPSGLFRYPLSKPLAFWCFQGISKENSGMKWVNSLFQRGSILLKCTDNILSRSRYRISWMLIILQVIWRMVPLIFKSSLSILGTVTRDSLYIFSNFHSIFKYFCCLYTRLS